MTDDSAAEDDPIRLDWRIIRSIDPVERVARALCKFDGLEPDSMASSNRTEPYTTEDGITVLRSLEEAAWKKYVREASRLVAAFRAFTGSNNRDREW